MSIDFQIPNFMNIPPVRAGVFPCGWTHRQTDVTKLIVAFAVLRTRLKKWIPSDELAPHAELPSRPVTLIAWTAPKPYQHVCDVIMVGFFVVVRRTSVLFLSISFIVLMVVALAWLSFYYVQRFRYVHNKDRLSVSKHNNIFCKRVPLKTLINVLHSRHVWRSECRKKVTI